MKTLLSTTTALALALSTLQPSPVWAKPETIPNSALSVTGDGSILVGDSFVLCNGAAPEGCDLEYFGLAYTADGRLGILRQNLFRKLLGRAADAQGVAAAPLESLIDAGAGNVAGNVAGIVEDAGAGNAVLGDMQNRVEGLFGLTPAEPEPAPEPTAEPTPEPTPEPAPAPAQTITEAPAVNELPLLALPTEIEKVFERAQQAEEAQAKAPVAEQPAQPVDLPQVNAEAENAVEALLGGASLFEALNGQGKAADAPTEAAPAPAPAAVAAAEADAGANAGTGVADAPEVTETTVTEANTRSSFEEFAGAPKLVEGGKKKSGLSDLEKAGLLALGAIVVGKVLSDGREVVANTGDRVVVKEPDGDFQVYKDDDTLLRRPGSTVRTESYRDGSTRTTVTREDGSQIVTIRDATGRVLRRAVYDTRGNETVLINDLLPETRIDVTALPEPTPGQTSISTTNGDAGLRAELARIEAERLGRGFSLRQIRELREVRRLAASIDVDNITFDTGSAVIRTTEARKLADLGRIMADILANNPYEVFLVEGHTDAVGSAASNLTLSDRRAESVALALTEYFGVPPENMVVQGYGEYDLRIQTDADERRNRRVAVRVITPLLQTATR